MKRAKSFAAPALLWSMVGLVVPTGCVQAPPAAVQPATAAIDLTVVVPGRRVQALTSDVVALRVVVEAADGHVFEREAAVGAPLSIGALPAGNTLVHVTAVDADARTIGAVSATTTLAAGQTAQLTLTMRLFPEVQPLPSPVGLSGSAAALPAATLEDVGLTLPSGYTWGHVLALDPLGNVWTAAESWTLKQTLVWRLGADGQIDREIVLPIAGSIRQLQVDSQEHVWIGNGAMSRYAPDGTRVVENAGGSPSVVDKQDHLWTVGPSGRLRRVSPTGAVVGTFEMGEPVLDLALDRASGHIWVLLDQHILRKLAADGQVLASVRVPLTRVGDAHEPFGGVTVDSAGRAWVTSLRQATVTRVAPTGEVEAQYQVGAAPIDIALDGNGNAWVRSLTSHAGNLLKIDGAGVWLGALTVGRGLTYPEDDYLEDMRYFAIAGDRHGRVWIQPNDAALQRLAL